MKIPLTIRNRFVLLADVTLTIFSIFLAYIIRLELFAVFYDYWESMLWMIGISILIKIPIFYFLGLYRRVWAYASISELKTIVVGVTVSSIVVAIVMMLLFANLVFYAFPRSVLVIDWMQQLVLVGGIRFTLRLLSESKSGPKILRQNGKPQRQILVVGAGDAGAMVVKELQRNSQLNMIPIGFLDDDLQKQRQQIYGISVLGQIKDLPRIVKTNRIDEIIIAIPSASGSVVRGIASVSQSLKIPFRTMPGIHELLGGKVNLNQLREVDITDLLRRKPAQIEDDRIGNILTGRKVLVTGAGGSIGSELCRQIARWNPEELILLGHGENSIFESYLELSTDFPNLKIIPIIADIRDYYRLDSEIKKHHPAIIFHAAAHKHVPLMERNVEDCILNNVLGTKNLLKTCEKNQVEKFVYISTDKAVRPVNVMGASKRLAEELVIHSAERSGKAYSVVRFGNVLGSRGSVVPLFKRQIARGGPVTITHPEMRRYFMTIPEAVYLVLQAASMGKGGETFVLNMGEQVKILDLAKDLIRLTGLEPGKDIEIIFTGVREGEKLSEDLWNSEKTLEKTNHPDILKEEGNLDLSGNDFSLQINRIIQHAKNGERLEIITLLNSLITSAEIKPSPVVELVDVT